ncbi:ABC transporter ATP-binding protein [Chloroflexi bacterium TSY]|nr:ABC transporter ATP-binding protein [Chloroflexi bacterium TSY]
MNTILEITSLLKRFGGLVAVNNVDLTIESGEIRGLIGPNGSGKTTVINLISGIYKADRGQVRYQGHSIAGMQPNAIAQAGMLRTFQVPKLFGNMTVLENMMIPHFARTNPYTGGDMNQATQRAKELIELTGLTHLTNEEAKSLSGGQQALLQIARGFMVDNIGLYLLDEPFAGVNPVIKETINNLILRQNREENVAFLLVSHEMEQIRKLCHQVTALAEGAVIAQGSLDEVASDPQVIQAYLGGTGS